MSNEFIGRFEIKEESGEWKFGNELKRKLLSEGGEAIVLKWIFGRVEMAVRIHLFDAYLFTDKFAASELKCKTHLISGKIDISFFVSKTLKILKKRRNTNTEVIRVLSLFQFRKTLSETSRMLKSLMLAMIMRKIVLAGSL